MTARRRDVLLSAGAFLAAATLPGRAGSAQATGAAGGPPEVVLSGGLVVSMDPLVGDLERGDVHVRDGAIVRVPEPRLPQNRRSSAPVVFGPPPTVRWPICRKASAKLAGFGVVRGVNVCRPPHGGRAGSIRPVAISCSRVPR
ncbi:hypothetical protein [Methylorubrum extorquens]|uniref:hypothetical protein n=1 Tax=Methylorubrum extorquens TaxID=408 RepID=UPI00209CC1C0|nr:hypothetical protein [Methylorubrum extorquens]MCP1535577.1 hypothetical protein [Methylorubrum extorquens]